MKKLFIGLSVIGCIIGCVLLGKVGYDYYQSKHPVDVYQYRSDIKVNKSQHYITVFYDLKCPDCKNLHDETINSPEMHHLLKEKNATIKYVPHPILSNNGLSNQFANMADSVNTVAGRDAYVSFINTSYQNMDEKDPVKMMKKLSIGNDDKQAIEKDFKAKNINEYKNKAKQTKQFNITETPTVYVDDQKVNFNDTLSEIEKLKK